MGEGQKGDGVKACQYSPKGTFLPYFFQAVPDLADACGDQVQISHENADHPGGVGSGPSFQDTSHDKFPQQPEEYGSGVIQLFLPPGKPGFPGGFHQADEKEGQRNIIQSPIPGKGIISQIVKEQSVGKHLLQIAEQILKAQFCGTVFFQAGEGKGAQAHFRQRKGVDDLYHKQRSGQQAQGQEQQEQFAKAYFSQSNTVSEPEEQIEGQDNIHKGIGVEGKPHNDAGQQVILPFFRLKGSGGGIQHCDGSRQHQMAFQSKALGHGKDGQDGIQA